MSQLVIHKVTLPLSSGTHKVEVPVGSKAVRVARQRGSIALWYVFPKAMENAKSREVWTVYSILTGAPFVMATGAAYLGTVQSDDETFVLHVFLYPGWKVE